MLPFVYILFRRPTRRSLIGAGVSLLLTLSLGAFFKMLTTNRMIPVVMPSRAKLPSCSCCGFNLNFAYLKSYAGLLKILQLVGNYSRLYFYINVGGCLKASEIVILFYIQIIAGLCKSMLMNFGLKYASLIGFSYDAFLTAISGSAITTGVLLLTYIWSENSMRLVRSSLLVIS